MTIDTQKTVLVIVGVNYVPPKCWHVHDLNEVIDLAKSGAIDSASWWKRGSKEPLESALSGVGWFVQDEGDRLVAMKKHLRDEWVDHLAKVRLQKEASNDVTKFNGVECPSVDKFLPDEQGQNE